MRKYARCVRYLAMTLAERTIHKPDSREFRHLSWIDAARLVRNATAGARGPGREIALEVSAHIEGYRGVSHSRRSVEKWWVGIEKASA